MTLNESNALSRLSGGEYSEHIMRIAANVTALRTAKGWSMTRLAAEADLTTAYVSLIEMGQQNVTVRIMTKLANALGVPIERLLKARK